MRKEYLNRWDSPLVNPAVFYKPESDFVEDYMQLDQFIKENSADMLLDLTDIVSQCKAQIRDNPNWYIKPGSDAPSIDVRLCIDLTERFCINTPSWIIRTALVDYDQYHSEYCAALSIGLDTDTNELLNDLINQLD